MGGKGVVIESILTGVLLAVGLLFVVFYFVHYAVSDCEECEHIHKVTYDSYGKQVCINCGKEFLITKGNKK